MADAFAAIGSDTAVANNSLANIFSVAGARRAYLYYLLLTCKTAADNMDNYHLQRTTAVGTEGSGLTPTPLDPGGSASAFDVGIAHTAEPTYTASTVLLAINFHQRAPFIFQTLPKHGIVLPATTNNGVGIRCIATGAGPTHEFTAHWEE